MSYLYNNLSLKQRRRDLRKGQTDCERLLWTVLKNKQCNGYRFLRQYSIGNYILDFFCPKLRLAIELDGGQHNDPKQKAYDNQRTAFLEKQNIKVLRFWDNEVLENLDGSPCQNFRTLSLTPLLYLTLGHLPLFQGEMLTAG